MRRTKFTGHTKQSDSCSESNSFLFLSISAQSRHIGQNISSANCTSWDQQMKFVTPETDESIRRKKIILWQACTSQQNFEKQKNAKTRWECIKYN